GTLTPEAGRAFGTALAALPEKMTRCLATLAPGAEARAPFPGLAARYKGARDFLFLGRGPNYPIALEGALKLKEISYIHAEGYAAGEMKHGPIALIDDGVPVVVLVPKGPSYEKTLSNLAEVRARNGSVLAVATEGDKHIAGQSDEQLFI